MKFELSDEHVEVQSLCREFAEKELAPIAAKTDKTGVYPAEAMAKAAEIGLMGISIPTEWGGSGMDPLSYVLMIEEVSRVCGSSGVILSVNNSLCCEVIKNFGTDDQKKAFLIPLAKGEKLGAYCLTEPESGSDAGTMTTSVVKDGDTYVINGAKNFITNGPQADVLILFAMQYPDKGSKGVTAFIVDAKADGVEVGAEELKMGIKGSGTCTIAFNDLRLPASSLLGVESEGFKVAMKTLDNGRIGIAAKSLGIAQAAVDAAKNYLKEREQFGKSLSQMQGLRWRIADMETDVEAARLLVYQAATIKTKGELRLTRYAAMAKLFASETASRVANEALQMFGGYGYTKDYPVERYVRDARICELYEGTSEIQRLVIATQFLRENPL